MGRISYFLFLQLLVISCHHALAKPSPPSDDSEQPKHQIHDSIVSIQLKDANHSPKDRHICTGVIVSERHVITEFRCLERNYNFSWKKVFYFDVEAMQIATTGEGGSEKLHDIESLSFWHNPTIHLFPAPPPNVVVITLKDSVNLTASPKAAISSQDPRGKNASLFAWIAGNDGTLAMEHVPLHTLRHDECKQHYNGHLERYILCTVRLDKPNEMLNLPAYRSAVIADDAGVVALDYTRLWDPPYLIFHTGIEMYREFIENVTTAAASS